MINCYILYVYYTNKDKNETFLFKITEDSCLDCKVWAEVILKIPVPVISNGIGLPKFWFWFGMDLFWKE
jgi:hypothetical protein